MATPDEIAADALQREQTQLQNDITAAKAVISNKDATITALLNKYEPRTPVATGTKTVIPWWIWVVIGLLVLVIIARG
jgi:hypothetical protein